MSLTFKRTIENFICEHCGFAVTGNGYTNHCPQCLYSRHVDVHPGDRAAACGGLMKPIGLENKGKDWMVVQECVKCGFKRRNRLLAEDNREAIIGL